MKNSNYVSQYKSLTLISMFFFTVQLFGCKGDFLEAKPEKNLAVPETLQDFQGLLDRTVTVTANSPMLGDIASDGHYVIDPVYQNRTKNYATDAYIWSKTVSHLSPISGWGLSYQRILYCNIILDELKKLQVSGVDEQIKYNNIKGQALFQRARSFFELAQIYAPPYSEFTASNDLGIVLRLSSDITIVSRRSTVLETYNQILSNLLESKDLLPDRPAFLTRASKSATLALLARVYLAMEDYTNALKYADECLKIYTALLDYNSVPISASFIGRYNSEVLFHANSQAEVFLTTNYLVDRDFYLLYQTDDLRRTRLFRENTNQTITFKGNYDGTASSLFSGLATDEVYLIRAECYARKGMVTEALKDLNDLMKMRWDKTKSYPIITAIDPEDALRKVLLERRKELVNRGIRWSDLRRLNKDPRFAVTLKRTVLGVEYTLEPNSYKYTFPIPDDIIQQTGLKQNPGWPN